MVHVNFFLCFLPKTLKKTSSVQAHQLIRAIVNELQVWIHLFWCASMWWRFWNVSPQSLTPYAGNRGVMVTAFYVVKAKNVNCINNAHIIIICKSKREDLQHGIETCYDVWFGDGGTDRKIGDRVEDVKIFTGSDQDRQDYKWVRQRDRWSWVVGRQS